MYDFGVPDRRQRADDNEGEVGAPHLFSLEIRPTENGLFKGMFHRISGYVDVIIQPTSDTGHSKFIFSCYHVFHARPKRTYLLPHVIITSHHITITSHHQMPSKRPAYRADRPHCDFLTDIASQLPPSRRSPEHFAQALHAQIARQFQVDLHPPAVITENEDENSDISDIVRAMPVMENAEFQDLHEKLKAINPSFSPRTYFIDDLPSE